MRETSFIRQNKHKWQEFESVLDGQYHDPDKLNDLFIQITDDLSYSRTFYPNRSVRVYLNGLAQRIFFTIYKSRRSPLKRLAQFWLEELPQLMYEARREFLLAFLVFLLSFGIGAFSSAMDPEFVKVILGEGYVSMTLENIESGDPMRVYKHRGELGMSLGITANNLWVAFLTFVMGVFYMIGSIVIMIYNGIMVGAFQYFFIEKGLFWESFLTIWIHGTLEISAIIIAGTAGITMGKGLVFPGTHTRAQSFQRSARRGVKIMVGIAPIIILAGFIEGYLTRHTDTPDFVRGMFILICLLFVLMYFVWYPYVKARNRKNVQDVKIPADRAQKLDFTLVKSSGEIFGDVFTFYTRHFGKIMLLSLANSLVFSFGAFALSKFNLAEKFFFPAQLFGTFQALPQFFKSGEIVGLPFLSLVVLGVLLTGTFAWLRREGNAGQKSNRSEIFAAFVKNMAAISPILLTMYFFDFYTPYLVLILLPITLLWDYVMQVENINLFQGLRRTFSLLKNNVGRTIGLLVVLLLVGLLFFLVNDTIVLSFYLDLVSWVVYLDDATMQQVSVILFTFTAMLVLQLVLVLFISGFGIMYYTLREIAEATHLRERIQQMGLAKRIKGLEQEV
ncbi:MAG: stage II sporulation protein M [Saprospiraceae bacterium]|nr:stage II sporulation protein M [Saprospiraceae bacterium]